MIRLDEKGIKNFVYEPPRDPEKLLYDFYFIVGYMYGGKQDDPSIDFAFKEAVDVCTNHLKKHMLHALKWSISAEMRHVFDLSDIVEHIKKGSFSGPTEKFLRAYSKYLALYSAEDGYADLNRDRISRLKKGDETLADPSMTRVRGGYSGVSATRDASYKESYLAIKRAQKAAGLSEEDFGLAARDAFGIPSWTSNYGGDNWAKIGNAYTKLFEAEALNKKIIYIDHAYDLQHNSGSVFTKIKGYYSQETGFDWIENALDWKKKSTDLRDFYEKVSLQLKPVVAWVAKNNQGKTMQDYWRPKKSTSSKKKKKAEDYIEFFNSLKVGDEVQVKRNLDAIHDTQDTYLTPAMKKLEGRTFKVLYKFDSPDRGKIINLNGSAKHWNWAPYWLEYPESTQKSEPESGPEDINIGDIIKVLDNGASYTSYQKWANLHGLTSYQYNKGTPKNSETYKVVAKGPHLVGKDQTLIGIENFDGDKQYIIGLRPGTVKKVSKTSLKKSFKVGDKVRAISASYGWGEVHKGDIGTVSKVNKDGSYIVDFPAQKHWSAEDFDLELVEVRQDKGRRRKEATQLKKLVPRLFSRDIENILNNPDPSYVGDWTLTDEAGKNLDKFSEIALLKAMLYYYDKLIPENFLGKMELKGLYPTPNPKTSGKTPEWNTSAKEFFEKDSFGQILYKTLHAFLDPTRVTTKQVDQAEKALKIEDPLASRQDLHKKAATLV